MKWLRSSLIVVLLAVLLFKISATLEQSTTDSYIRVVSVKQPLAEPYKSLFLEGLRLGLRDSSTLGIGRLFKVEIFMPDEIDTDPLVGTISSVKDNACVAEFGLPQSVNRNPKKAGQMAGEAVRSAIRLKLEPPPKQHY